MFYCYKITVLVTLTIYVTYIVYNYVRKTRLNLTINHIFNTNSKKGPCDLTYTYEIVTFRHVI